MTSNNGPVSPAGEGGPVVVPGNTADDADPDATDPVVGAGPELRLRLDISYDGTDFVGWAVQPGLRTVAGVLSDALALLFRAPVPLVVAGRTDSGVHATGQVAHIDVPAAVLQALAPRHRRAAAMGEQPDPAGGPAGDRHADGIDGLRRRLAGLLPTDLRVRRIAVAAPGFDARFSALRRHYRYRIGTAAWGVDPLGRIDVLARPRELDAVAMDRAGAALIGLQDFATYCKAREGATTIRELQRLTVAAEGDEVVVSVTADAFCHSMVRSLVGVLIAVGEGRMTIGEPAAMLAARRRTSAVHTAPARGLTLVGVDYPPDAELATRAEATRAVRVEQGPESDPR